VGTSSPDQNAWAGGCSCSPGGNDWSAFHQSVEIGSSDPNPTPDPQRGQLAAIDPVSDRLLVQVIEEGEARVFVQDSLADPLDDMFLDANVVHQHVHFMLGAL
jgi:hypothetical protein